jgi:hypothetical protein
MLAHIRTLKSPTRVDGVTASSTSNGRLFCIKDDTTTQQHNNTATQQPNNNEATTHNNNKQMQHYPGMS